ncbi:MAG: hypothetical protein HYZ52_07125 [Candidatus Omnitrophica bacterium]|nr:hypothetical protein [Candidatus Omnitrophota bacterium]
MIQALMQNEDFKTFIAHPEVQELFKDSEFKDVAQTRDFAKIVAHPKFMALMRVPELSSLMARLGPALAKFR